MLQKSILTLLFKLYLPPSKMSFPGNQSCDGFYVVTLLKKHCELKTDFGFKHIKKKKLFSFFFFFFLIKANSSFSLLYFSFLMKISCNKRQITSHSYLLLLLSKFKYAFVVKYSYRYHMPYTSARIYC